MARPRPKLLFSYEINQERILEIVAAESVWIIFYAGKPINLRERDPFLNTFKYLRLAFANQAHALNLVDKLNRRFNTDQFSVTKLSP